MRGNRHISSAAIVGLVSILLTGCHTTQKASTAYKSSKQPRFISDIYISGHNKTSTTADAITPAVPKPEKTKPANARHKVPSQEPATTTYSSAPVASTGKDLGVSVVPSGGSVILADPSFLRKKYSDILGIRPKEISNYPLYTFIDKWYGTNYRLGGSDKSGIDCSGFAQKLYGEVYGIDLLRTAMEQFANCKRIRKSNDAEEGDLVFFKVHSKKRITHVGVYLANNYFIHASSSGGVMISNLNEEYWHKYYAGCGRVPRS